MTEEGGPESSLSDPTPWRRGTPDKMDSPTQAPNSVAQQVRANIAASLPPDTLARLARTTQEGGQVALSPAQPAPSQDTKVDLSTPEAVRQAYENGTVSQDDARAALQKLSAGSHSFAQNAWAQLDASDTAANAQSSAGPLSNMWREAASAAASTVLEQSAGVSRILGASDTADTLAHAASTTDQYWGVNPNRKDELLARTGRALGGAAATVAETVALGGIGGAVPMATGAYEEGFDKAMAKDAQDGVEADPDADPDAARDRARLEAIKTLPEMMAYIALNKVTAGMAGGLLKSVDGVTIPSFTKALVTRAGAALAANELSSTVIAGGNAALESKLDGKDIDWSAVGDTIKPSWERFVTDFTFAAHGGLEAEVNHRQAVNTSTTVLNGTNPEYQEAQAAALNSANTPQTQAQAAGLAQQMHASSVKYLMDTGLDVNADDQHTVASNAVGNLMGAMGNAPDGDSYGRIKLAVMNSLPKTLQPQVQEVYDGVKDMVMEARTAKANNATATATELLTQAHAKANELVRAKFPSAPASPDAAPVVGAIPAFKYGVDEDPGTQTFPGQIGDRRADTLDGHYGEVTLSQKLSDADMAKYGLRFNGETKVNGVLPSPDTAQAPTPPPLDASAVNSKAQQIVAANAEMHGTDFGGLTKSEENVADLAKTASYSNAYSPEDLAAYDQAHKEITSQLDALSPNRNRDFAFGAAKPVAIAEDTVRAEEQKKEAASPAPIAALPATTRMEPKIAADTFGLPQAVFEAGFPDYETWKAARKQEGYADTSAGLHTSQEARFNNQPAQPKTEPLVTPTATYTPVTETPRLLSTPASLAAGDKTPAPVTLAAPTSLSLDQLSGSPTRVHYHGYTGRVVKDGNNYYARSADGTEVHVNQEEFKDGDITLLDQHATSQGGNIQLNGEDHGAPTFRHDANGNLTGVSLVRARDGKPVAVDNPTQALNIALAYSNDTGKTMRRESPREAAAEDAEVAKEPKTLPAYVDDAAKHPAIAQLSDLFETGESSLGKGKGLVKDSDAYYRQATPKALEAADNLVSSHIARIESDATLTSEQKDAAINPYYGFLDSLYKYRDEQNCRTQPVASGGEGSAFAENSFRSQRAPDAGDGRGTNSDRVAEPPRPDAAVHAKPDGRAGDDTSTNGDQPVATKPAPAKRGRGSVKEEAPRVVPVNGRSEDPDNLPDNLPEDHPGNTGVANAKAVPSGLAAAKNNWVNAHFKAYAAIDPATGKGPLYEWLLTRLSPDEASKAVKREMLDREKAGRPLGDPKLTRAWFEKYYDKCFRMSRTGNGVDTSERLPETLNILSKQFALNEEKSGSPRLTGKVDENGEPVPHWFSLTNKVTSIAKRQGRTGGLLEADGSVSGSDTGAGVTPDKNIGGGADPSKGLVDSDKARLIEQLRGEVVNRIREFAKDRETALDDVDLRGASEDDIARATEVLVNRHFGYQFGEKMADRGVHMMKDCQALLDDEGFNKNVDDLVNDIKVSAREKFPELNPRYSLATEERTARRGDMVAQHAYVDATAKAEGYDGFADLAKNNEPRFSELAAKWREEHPPVGWKLTDGTETGAGKLDATDAANMLRSQMSVKELPPVAKEALKNTVVVQSEADLPEHLKNHITLREVAGRVRGVYDNLSDRIYLVADAHSTPHDLTATFLHEAVGEHGIDQVLGKENWNSLAKTLLGSDRAQEIAQTYFGSDLKSLDANQRGEVAREVLSHLAENETQAPSLRRQVLDHVRALLRSAGFNLTYTDSDIAFIVRKARNQDWSSHPESKTDSDVAFKLDPDARETAPVAKEAPTADADPLPEPSDQEKADLSDLEARTYATEHAEEPEPLSKEQLKALSDSQAEDERVSRVASDYRTGDGAKGLMEEIAKRARKDSPWHAQLAAMFAKHANISGHEIHLDPTLAEDGLGGMADLATGKIFLDPSVSPAEFHENALHETLHQILFDKLEAFARGDFTNLSESDRTTLGEINKIYQEVLGKAPQEVQDLVSSGLSPDEVVDQFVKWGEEKSPNVKWYPAVDIHEFSAGVLTKADFQTMLDKLDVGTDVTAKAKGVSPLSPLRRVWNSIVRLVGGGKIAEGSALHKATTGLLDLISSKDKVQHSIIDFGKDRELGSLKTFLKDKFDLATGGKDSRKEFRTGLVRFFQDRFVDLRLCQEKLAESKGLAVLPDTQNAYQAQELYHGRLGDRLANFTKEYPEVFGKMLRQAKIATDEMNDFLYALHAPEANDRAQRVNPRFAGTDGGSGMTTADANAKMRSYRADPRFADFQAIAAKVDAMNKESLQGMRDNGLITKDQFVAMSKGYQHYVALQGFEDPEAGLRAGLEKGDTSGVLPNVGQGFDIRGYEPARRTGRTSKAADILQNTVEGAARVIVRSEKNRVGRAMANLIRSNPDPALWDVATKPYKEVADKETGIVTRHLDPKWMDDSHVFAFKENGETKYFRIENDALARNWKNGGPATQDTVAKYVEKGLGVMTRLNHYLSFFNTQGSPEFIAAKAFRDLQETMFNLTGPQQEGMRMQVAKDIVSGAAFRGVREVLRKGTTTSDYAKSYKEMSSLGGNIVFFGLDSAQDNISSSLNSLDAGKPKQAMRSLLGFIKDYDTCVESASRLAVFKNLRDAGVSPDQAAHAARNITVNFNRKGEAGPALGALYLFYNAKVQTTARLYESLRSRGWRNGSLMAMKLMGLGFSTAAMARYMAGKDKDDGRDLYDKIPDYVRHSNLIFMLPQGMRDELTGVPGIGRFISQDGSYIKVPMPYGASWLVGAGSTMEKYVTGNMSASNALINTASSAMDTFNPVGGVGTVLQQLTPTLARPLTDISINKDYAGKPIVPPDAPYGVQKPPHMQFYRSANPTIVEATSAVNSFFGGDDVRGSWASVSPQHVEYMLNYTLGSLGSLVGRAATFYPNMHKADVTGEVFTANNVPGFRRFFGAPDDSDTSQAYSSIRDASKLTSDEATTYLKAGNVDDAKKVVGDHISDVYVNKLVTATEQQRAQLHQKINALRSAPVSAESTDQGQRALAALYDEDRALQKRVILAYMSAQHALGRPTDFTNTK